MSIYKSNSVHKSLAQVQLYKGLGSPVYATSNLVDEEDDDLVDDEDDALQAREYA